MTGRFALILVLTLVVARSAAADDAGLSLRWEKRFLTISGSAIPGGPVRVHYLEAYCRPGSTDRDWSQTVIRHESELVSASADGHDIELLDRLADGVTVRHRIRAGLDEVAFHVEAHNPTDMVSEAHWAQPCIRLAAFTGSTQQDYLPQCFIFVDGKLTTLPTEPWATKARYTPGQVYVPRGVDRNDVNPRPVSSLVPSNGLCGVFSADRKMMLAAAWEPYQELFQGVIVCMHTDFRIGGLKPGERKTIRGKLYIVPADEQALLRRYDRDFPEQTVTRAERSTPASALGLSVGPNATVQLAGKPFRGIGVNYFDCFLRALKSGSDTSYDAGFAKLAERKIPFARFCATGFWPRDMRLFREDKAEYFRRLDGVVASAEKHGIGLVPSLFWYSACVPDLVGEPMDEWANPASKTQAWMREYVREVVTRYRDRPAIWAWEFGNEYALSADLPNAAEHRPPVHPTLDTARQRSQRDELSFAMVRSAFTAFASEVRKHDSSRLILSGDSLLRRSAWHQQRQRTWKPDSLEQYAEMLTQMNPDPIDAISLHVYGDDSERLDKSIQVANQLGKPLCVGEFGAGGQSPEQRAKFERLLGAIVERDIPLAALWVYDFANQPDLTVTADNVRAWQLEAIATANRKLQHGGQARP